VRAAEFMLQTFEQRRNQLIAKATISATAASGLIVLVLQTWPDRPNLNSASRVCSPFHIRSHGTR
jgi:hypothetical protein